MPGLRGARRLIRRAGTGSSARGRVFDGVNSPVTQSFGLGLFEPLSPASLDRIEAFFLTRGRCCS